MCDAYSLHLLRYLNLKDLKHLLDVELKTLPGEEDSVPMFGAGAYPLAEAATAALAAVAP